MSDVLWRAHAEEALGVRDRDSELKQAGTGVRGSAKDAPVAERQSRVGAGQNRKVGRLRVRETELERAVEDFQSGSAFHTMHN